MTSTNSYEVIIIGGGKAGKTLAADLGRHGIRTALIERDPAMVGGTCINVACIPTKSFVECAKVAHVARHASDYGVSTGTVTVEWLAVRQRVEDVVLSLRAMNLKLLTTAPALEFIIGQAAFVSATEVQVALPDGSTRVLSAPKIFINTGTQPAAISIPGLDEADVLTSNTVQRLDELPRHLVVIGGGYVAIEFAQLFRRLGSVVTLVARGPRLLPGEEPEAADALTALLQAEGIEVHLNAAISTGRGRGESLVLTAAGPAGEFAVVGTHLLAAVGRSPVSAALTLAAAGVTVDAGGYITVNDRLETSVSGIWALGDCNGGPQFTHAALDDYRIVRANVFSGGRRSTRDRLMPASLFTDPELARVGLTEKEARALGRPVKVAVVPASVIPRARTSGHTAGLMKAIVDAASGEILGVTLLAAGAGEMISTVELAMIGKLPYPVLRDAVLTHPTMTEGLNYLFAGL